MIDCRRFSTGWLYVVDCSDALIARAEGES